MPEEIFLKEHLPHEEWLTENKEFINENNIPKEIKKKINATSMAYGRYKSEESPEKASNFLNGCKKQSYTVADELQTWKETVLQLSDDDDNNNGNDDPSKNINKHSDGNDGNNNGSVELINGVPVTPEEKAAKEKAAQDEAKRKADEENKTKENDKNKSKGIIGGLLTLAGIGLVTFFGFKILNK